MEGEEQAITYRANVFRLSPTKEQEKVLFELADACSALYNAVNYRRRQSFFAGEIDWDTEQEYEAFREIVGSATAQQVIRKNDEAWRSFLALLAQRKRGELPAHIRRVSPPRYWKDRRTGKRELRVVLRSDTYQLHRNVLSIPLGKALQRRHGLKRLVVRWRGLPRWRGKQGRLEIWYDPVTRCWYAAQSVRVKLKKRRRKPLTKEKVAVVDLNVVVPAASLAQGERQALGYSGRELLADWWYWSKQISRYMAKVTEPNNGSYATRHLRRLYRRRQRRLKHALATLAKSDMLRFRKLGVTLVVVDYPEAELREQRRGRKLDAMLNNHWCYRFLFERYSAWGEVLGIRVIKASELKENPFRGSSNRCPRCGSSNVALRKRMLRCRDCSLEAHRDSAACINALISIGAVREGGRSNGVVAHPVLLRWDRSTWRGGTNPQVPAAASVA